MKPLFFLFPLFVTLSIHAQIPRPQLSPKAKLVQTVGLSEVTIDYARPSVRERTIFGDLVPYNVRWRTGANRNTLITFSHDVVISGQPLSKGTYALYTTPNKDAWMVYFYNKTDNWGTPAQWDEQQISLAVRVEVHDVSHTESFRISIENITLDTADLQLVWEKTAIQLPIVFPTNKIMESNLSKMNVDTASANDLYTAAVYYFNNDKDLKIAKEWITKAVALRDDAFWFYRQKSLIHEALGELNMAIDAAQRSLELAESAGNQRFIDLNKKQLLEWTEK
tara:strand:- start:2872 stop:3711 length:840 start_codon:yes stop_codon:yes gene_type:complete